MAGTADLLAGLRDLRLPVSNDPPAADAAAAFAVALALVLLVAQLARLVTRRRTSARAAALAELAAARRLAPQERLLAQVRLLRRLAGPVEDGDWHAALDRRLGTRFFTAGDGAVLGRSLYRPGLAIDPEQLDGELVRLLRRLRG